MIQVVVDDLAFVQVDAVLRPADDGLAPLTPAMSRVVPLAGARFAVQMEATGRREGGAWVVARGGDLARPYVLHVVLRDERSQVGRDIVRRALLSAWQGAGDWGLDVVAAPLVGAGAGQLTVEEAATLLAE